MHITQLQLKNFRCFADHSWSFDHPLVVIEGLNGVGKTSLLEALHYLCYLRSFRTHSPRELMTTGSGSFFIKISLRTDAQEHEIQVGVSGAKRLVKINQKTVNSYKDLMGHYRVVTLTEDDLALIKEGPEVRRNFIDQVIMLHNPDFVATIRTLRHLVDSRNKMLYGGMRNSDLYAVFTKQLWDLSVGIQEQRRSMLDLLQQEAGNAVAHYFGHNAKVDLLYKPKLIEAHESFDDFMERNINLYTDEQRYGRSLFGAHLDDVAIIYADKPAKQYASRGQQKLIIMLLKIAQLRHLFQEQGSAIFLLDDFMTDFDEFKAERVVQALIDLGIQLIFTAPVKEGPLTRLLVSKGGHRVFLG